MSRTWPVAAFCGFATSRQVWGVERTCRRDRGTDAIARCVFGWPFGAPQQRPRQWLKHTALYCWKCGATTRQVEADASSQLNCSRLAHAALVSETCCGYVLTRYVVTSSIHMSLICFGAVALVAGKIGSDARGAGRTWSCPQVSRWSAGRRRTPTSLGCAPSQRRGGPRHGPPGCAAAHPAPPGAPFPSPAREAEKGKGRARRPKFKVSGRRSVCCLTSVLDQPDCPRASSALPNF
jgi:hypothetical protein